MRLLWWKRFSVLGTDLSDVLQNVVVISWRSVPLMPMLCYLGYNIAFLMTGLSFFYLTSRDQTFLYGLLDLLQFTIQFAVQFHIRERLFLPIFKLVRVTALVGHS